MFPFLRLGNTHRHTHTHTHTQKPGNYDAFPKAIYYSDYTLDCLLPHHHSLAESITLWKSLVKVDKTFGRDSHIKSGRPQPSGYSGHIAAAPQ